MTHKATQIVDAVKTAVTGLATTGDNVQISRAFPTGKLPAISITQGSDKVDRIISNSKVDRTLTLTLSIIVQGEADSLDDQATNIEAEIWRAIMADVTLGLTHLIDIIPDGLTAFEVSQNNETPSLQAESSWRFVYRHSLADPEL
ncbi:MAG: hypothetical protein GY818_07075 [Planctomycetaceae bacterium]|nr:hypothetical protein [Planctomycetaceae bacterium]